MHGRFDRNGDRRAYQTFAAGEWAIGGGKRATGLVANRLRVLCTEISEPGCRPAEIPKIMQYVPPVSLLNNWIEECAVTDDARLAPVFDDVLDVLKTFLGAIPIDDDWYKAEYPAVGDYLLRATTETTSTHFQKHGYFEGRKPFAPGWRDLIAPVPFVNAYASLRITPFRGRLRVAIGRDELLSLIKNILIAVPVDEPWYRAAYPKAAKAIDSGDFSSAAGHYAQRGYFDGYMPFEFFIDEEWYAARYEHVRVGLERGVAKSAKDHFMRIGYIEGCRPAPPP